MIFFFRRKIDDFFRKENVTKKNDDICWKKNDEFYEKSLKKIKESKPKEKKIACGAIILHTQIV